MTGEGEDKGVVRPLHGGAYCRVPNRILKFYFRFFSELGIFFQASKQASFGPFQKRKERKCFPMPSHWKTLAEIYFLHNPHFSPDRRVGQYRHRAVKKFTF